MTIINQALSNKLTNMSFVCACLIVILHSPASSSRGVVGIEYFSYYLTIIAVPVFFIISGFLLANKIKLSGQTAGTNKEYTFRWWLPAVKKRVCTLLVPLWTLSLLWYPVKFVIHYIGVQYCGAEDFGGMLHLSVRNVLTGIGAWYWGNTAIVGFWYLKSLFLLVIISPLLWIAVSKSIWRAICSLVTLVAAWCVQMNYAGDLVYDPLELNLRCPLFFILGMVLNLYAPEKLPRRIWLLLLPVCVVTYWLRELNADSDMTMRSLSYLASILSLSAMIWSLIPKEKWPNVICRNSFPLFALHGIVLYVLPLPLKAFHCWQSIVDICGPLPIAAVTILISIGLSELVKRFLPRFAVVVFGGRC